MQNTSSDRCINKPGRSSDTSSGLYVNSVSPTGKAGGVTVNSPRITLDNQGQLNAESASGNGGNINLTSNLLLLRRGSQISTNAGTIQQGGDGATLISIPHLWLFLADFLKSRVFIVLNIDFQSPDFCFRLPYCTTISPTIPASAWPGIVQRNE